MKIDRLFKINLLRLWVLLLFACIGIPAIIFFILVWRGGEAGPDFKRIQSQPQGYYSQNVFQDYHLKQFKSKDTNYIYAKSEGVSMNGESLILREENEKRYLDFFPGIKGRFSSRIEFLILLKKKTNKIYLQVFHNKEKIMEQDFSQTGTYAFDSDFKLSNHDRITVVAQGEGAVLLGRPIFYKKKPVEERSYIFLICADTLRADHLPTYGYDRETAPNIHHFSRDSVVFENAYSQSPWTLPSHMSLFTSLYEYNHGVKKAGTLTNAVDFLVEELSLEFSTRSINGGSWVSADFGFFRGFDLYKSYGRCGPRPDSAKFLFEKTIEDIKKLNFPRSFYFLHSYQIHTPYQPRHEFVSFFNPNQKYKQLTTPIHLNNKKITPDEATKIKIPMIDLYDGEIRSFDHWFGKFISFLKKENIYDRAMIIFLYDHGEAFFEHHKWGHSHSLYNEVTRVPLIIKFPGSRYRGVLVKHQVGLIDIMPTILNFYSIDFNWENKLAKVDGCDLIPVIKGKSLKRPIISSITSGFYSPGHAFKVAIFEDQYKIICNFPYKKLKSNNVSSFSSLKRFEFYELYTDPGETLNVYLKQMSRIRKFQGMFDRIIEKGIYNIKQKGKKVTIDKKMQDELKTLGYL
jgi:arylsulfatase A-like enzyme